ncbi:MAG: folate-binding protein [Pseudomonadota bacterium]
MCAEQTEGRVVIRIAGTDRHKFLHGLVTRDPVPGGMAYSALLSPQGKFLADFFLIDRDDDILLDVTELFADGLLQRLKMYKLRSDVTLEVTDMPVTQGLDVAPEGAFDDPRDPHLGWRAYGMTGGPPQIDWDAIRVAHNIPQSGVELLSNETYILEAGFDRLGGVDHSKGCYVGQEVTARMKHKTVLRKGYVTVSIDGSAEVGTPVMLGERAVGMLFTQSGDQAIAYLRFDRAGAGMTAGQAQITWDGAEAAQ